MEQVEKDKYAKADKDLKVKLFTYKKDIAKEQTIIDTLQKEMETLTGKLQKAYSKSMEFSTKEQELQEFIEKAINTQKKM